MDVDRNHDSNKGASGSRHNFLLSFANHSREVSTEWRIFTSALIWALFSDTRKMIIPLSPTISFLLCCTAASSFLYTCGLSYQLSSKSHKIQHVVSSSISSQSPEVLFAWLQLLATNSHCELVWPWTFHGYDFSLSSILLFLGVGTIRWRLSAQAKRLARSEWHFCMFAVCVRACMHYDYPWQQRLIPSRSHRNDGCLWAVEFSDHVQILPWASPSQYSQK